MLCFLPIELCYVIVQVSSFFSAHATCVSFDERQHLTILTITLGCPQAVWSRGIWRVR